MGWRGFLPSCAETYAWTAKVANSDWVFGMVFVGEESDETCLASSFDLYAFPQKDNEERLPKIFQETMNNPEYTGMVRDLAKNFGRLQAFRLGQLVLAARLDKTGFSYLLQTYPNIHGVTDRDLRPL